MKKGAGTSGVGSLVGVRLDGPMGWSVVWYGCAKLWELGEFLCANEKTSKSNLAAYLDERQAHRMYSYPALRYHHTEGGHRWQARWRWARSLPPMRASRVSSHASQPMGIPAGRQVSIGFLHS